MVTTVLGMVAQACNPSTCRGLRQEVINVKPAWDTQGDLISGNKNKNNDRG